MGAFLHSLLNILEWALVVAVVLGVWGVVFYLIFWTWRKTRGRVWRRVFGFTGLAVFFFVMWAGSRIAP